MEPVSASKVQQQARRFLLPAGPKWHNGALLATAFNLRTLWRVWRPPASAGVELLSAYRSVLVAIAGSALDRAQQIPSSTSFPGGLAFPRYEPISATSSFAGITMAWPHEEICGRPGSRLLYGGLAPPLLDSRFAQRGVLLIAGMTRWAAGAYPGS